LVVPSKVIPETTVSLAKFITGSSLRSYLEQDFVE